MRDLLAAIAEALDDIQGALMDVTLTPHVQELRERASVYVRLLDDWAGGAPTDAQVDAVHECVMELHGEVVVASGCRPIAPPVTLAPEADEGEGAEGYWLRTAN